MPQIFYSCAKRQNKRYSGDNYAVMAKLGGAAEPAAGRTGVMTAWKRVYVEHDKMYKVGEDLTADALVGAKVLTVANTLQFVIGDTVHVFDRLNKQAGEYHTVAGKTATTLTLQNNLSQSYLLNDGLNDLFPHVAKPSVGNYAADTSQLYKSFDEAYVEFVVNQTGILPFIDHFDPVPPQYAAKYPTPQMYLDGRLPAFFSKILLVQSYANYIQVGACYDYEDEGQPLPEPLGLTDGFDLGQLNYSYIFALPITTADEMRETVNHEAGHQFAVNPPVATTGGHDATLAWCASTSCPGEPSLMQATVNGNSIYEFDLDDIQTIRTHPDNLTSD